MKKIFLESGPHRVDDLIELKGDDCFHLTKVLRVKRGESFLVSDNGGAEFKALVEEIGKRSVALRLKEEYRVNEEPGGKLTLFFSLLKGTKNDEIIRRGSEIGVDRFVPVITKHTVVELDPKSAVKRLERWNKIAREAAMQCGRREIAEITAILELTEVDSFCSSADYDKSRKLLAYASADLHLKTIFEDEKSFENLAIFTGPEGDFSPEEVEALQNSGWEPVRIAGNILRSETAAVYFSAIAAFYIK